MIYNKYNYEDGIVFYYTYNQLGQLVSFTTSSSMGTDAVYEYTESGQVKKLTLNPGANQQVLEYQYTIRDWLDNINAPYSNGVIGSRSAGNTLFAEKLYYGNPPSGSGVLPQYNGNISAAEYFSQRETGSVYTPEGSKVHRYAFQYDNLNRLTDAQYFYDPGPGHFFTGGNAYKENISEYDAMGNIKTLTRMDNSGSGLPWTYNYFPGSNKLKYVSNLHTNTSNYAYDANGNLTQDISKGINSNGILYTHQNLPYRINFSNGDITKFSYDANGNRISKIYTPSDGFEGSSSYYIYDAQGRTLAVYDGSGQLKFFNLYGLDLIGKLY
jgi:hypothetical protein